MTRDEVRAVLQHLDGIPRLLALLFYGAGLRLLEGARLRAQDVDFGANLIVVRDGKGGAKDRVTMLPVAVKSALARHLQGVPRQHERDLQAGAGWVSCRTPSGASTPTPAVNGPGSGCFRPRASTSTARPGNGAGIISTSRLPGAR